MTVHRVVLTHEATHEDRVREREMLIYYDPETDSTELARRSSRLDVNEDDTLITANQPISSDAVLTAFAQLCATRLQAQRAMISLIGMHKQYFIAEATRTTNLGDTTMCELPGDDLWVGCTTVDKSGRLCEHTLAAEIEAGRFPTFAITNLEDDSRFSGLPFVAGPPHFRFYAGTPLTTRKKINIGSLSIINNYVRPKLTAEEVEFIGTLAQTIMTHLEASAAAKEKVRIERLSTAMNAFVEGRSTMAIPRAKSACNPGTRQNTFRLSKSRSSSINSGFHSQKAAHNQSRTSFNSSDEDDLPDHSRAQKAELEASATFMDHRSTLVRASSLMYEALDIAGCGGVIYFDGTTKRRHGVDASNITNTFQGKGAGINAGCLPAEIIAAAVGTRGKSTERRPSKAPDFTPIDNDLLHDLLRRYPRGMLWRFDAEGFTSDDEDLPTSFTDETGDVQARGSKRHRERAQLKRSFPGVRQLLFYGLWDAGSSRCFTACIAWTTAHRPIYSATVELTFFISFGNSVMAEVSRLSSMAADRQKADFIGSISHELRSPLHGILASAEFLCEFVDDTFQRSLVNTISGCGRTLLDTITHILDFSKINSFERTRDGSRSPGKFKAVLKSSKTFSSKYAPPVLSVYATIDVGSLVEEVIEGVYAGQILHDISSTEALGYRNASRPGKQKESEAASSTIPARPKTKEIDVILDFTPAHYIFVAQPGAIKRLVMNIFGNALKYTQKGVITVKISLDDPSNHSEPMFSLQDAKNERLLHLTVTDTGKGISRQYLRTSLYNPFSQEDVLASGTGLGLSIVRSIVTMLQGAIDIQSEVGVGTEVSIWLPLSRVAGLGSEESTPNDEEQPRALDNSVRSLKRQHSGKVVALYGLEDDQALLAKVLRSYITDWYDMKVMNYPKNSPVLNAHVAITLEGGLEDLLALRSPNTPVIVIRDADKKSTWLDRGLANDMREFISKPCGLYKLANAMSACLEKGQVRAEGMSMATRSSIREQSRMEHMGNVKSRLTEAVTENQLALSAVERASVQSRGRSARPTHPSQYPFPGPMDLIARKSPTWPQSPSDIPRADFMDQSTLAPDSTGSKIGGDKTFPTKDPIPIADTRPVHLTVALPSVNNIDQPSPVSDTPSMEGTPKQVGHIPHMPQVLLVDDNKVNLHLLSTFMKKRKYPSIDLAENGQLALDAVTARTVFHGIIFTDISMPIMNGFEATRAIRDLETKRQAAGTLDKPALIVALTGLASGEDQAEAFASGVDLFITKPVSFEEVGKMLDNWERNG